MGQVESVLTSKCTVRRYTTFNVAWDMYTTQEISIKDICYIGEKVGNTFKHINEDTTKSNVHVVHLIDIINEIVTVPYVLRIQTVGSFARTTTDVIPIFDETSQIEGLREHTWNAIYIELWGEFVDYDESHT